MNEIQLAKGAIRAGTELFLRGADIDAAGLDNIVVAGALGTYLDLESAIRVGLLVDVERARYRQVGNAAGRGAGHLLLSRERRALVDVARSPVAYERGAVGSGRNCAYENVYLKAITGYPMTLEGAEGPVRISPQWARSPKRWPACGAMSQCRTSSSWEGWPRRSPWSSWPMPHES